MILIFVLIIQIYFYTMINWSAFTTSHYKWIEMPRQSFKPLIITVLSHNEMDKVKLVKC